MDIIEVLKISANSLYDDYREDMLRLVHSLYYLGLSGKLWVFRRPKLWQKQYNFAEDLAKIIQFILIKKRQPEKNFYLSSSYLKTAEMKDLLKVHRLLDKEIEDTLEDLLIEKIIEPNEIFLYSVVVADMLLAERRRYTVQFWTTFFIGILSIVTAVIAAYIGILK